MSATDEKKISIQDAIRLKHAINKKITHRGLDAQQIREMEELSADQYDAIKTGLTYIKKSWWFLPDKLLWILALVSAFIFFYFQDTIYQKMSIGLAIYCIGQLCYREGVYYGFTRGYEDGHVTAVHKALGLTPEDQANLHERAVEMQMDEMLIKRMDRQE